MYQSGGSERDSDAERMIANEMRILESPNFTICFRIKW